MSSVHYHVPITITTVNKIQTPSNCSSNTLILLTSPLSDSVANSLIYLTVSLCHMELTVVIYIYIYMHHIQFKCEITNNRIHLYMCIWFPLFFSLSHTQSQRQGLPSKRRSQVENNGRIALMSVTIKNLRSQKLVSIENKFIYYICNWEDSFFFNWRSKGVHDDLSNFLMSGWGNESPKLSF
jgi:hypothetical protein